MNKERNYNVWIEISSSINISYPNVIILNCSTVSDKISVKIIDDLKVPQIEKIVQVEVGKNLQKLVKMDDIFINNKKI